MKRNCNDCKALEISGNHAECYLNYQVKTEYGKHGMVKIGIPLEECPKPLTNKLFIELLHKHK